VSGQSNFQDVVVLSSNSLTMGVEALTLGTDSVSKSLIFAQDSLQATALFLAFAQNVASNSVTLPAGTQNVTAGLITGITFSGSLIDLNAIQFSGSAGMVLGMAGSTITAALSRLSALSLNDNAGTFNPATAVFTTSLSHTTNTTFSTGGNSAIRLSLIAPMNVSYLDPGGQQNLEVSGAIASNTAGSFTVTATVSWWAGLYTISGSTASVASSTSNSSSISLSKGSASTITGSSTVNLDARFTNLSWVLTLGDYLLIMGTTLSMSGAVSAAGNQNNNIGAFINQVAFGATRAQVSYSVPYFGDGTVGSSLASYTLGQIIDSGGTGVTSVAPRMLFLGS
jgi:hypothetical protein